MVKAFGLAAMKAVQTAAGRNESRGRMIGAVRAACKRLGIPDDDRRAIQLEVTGKASMADMELSDLGKLLDRLNRGWKGPMGHRGHIGKVRALWWTLYWLGAIDDPKDAALEAFVTRQTGKQKLAFLGHKEAFSVIEALKSWAGRQGVAWPNEQRLKDLRGDHPDLHLVQLERHQVLEALSRDLRPLGVTGRGYAAYCAAALKLPADHYTWGPRELDACIRLLGKRLRRELGKREAKEQ